MKKKKLTITILLSTYNGSKYIVDLLGSIKDQTRSPDYMLIKDDCSTDNTVNIIKNYIEINHLTNWKLIVNNINIGWKRNFHSMLAYVKTDCFMFCDQDDIWHADKVEKMMDCMENDDEIEVLVSNHKEFSNNLPPKTNLRVGIKKSPRRFNTSNLLINRYPGCVMCIRSTLINFYDLYWDPSIPHDAYAFLISMARGTLYVFNETLIEYRRHEGTATNNHKVSNRQERIEQTQDYKKYLDIVLQIQNEKQNMYGNKLNAKRYKKWIANRLLMLQKRSIKASFSQILYIDLYYSLLTYFKDLYYVILKEKN